MRTLITGGAGFIGTNLALHARARGDDVVVIDNLSRTEANLPFLEEAGVDVWRADATIIDSFVDLPADRIIHAAAQAAVTKSLVDPATDFFDNAYGTFKVLEVAREKMIPLLYLSTNKVYGPLTDVTSGAVSETRPLDPCTPYGCSKAAGDIYVSDWDRVFGVPTTVFRMSCIYGGHQYGDTHQGWVAHFFLSALRGEEITVYGDGTQVRDLLHIDDLISAVDLAFDSPARGVYNIGGGLSRKISVNALLDWIRTRGVNPRVVYEKEPRAGDQKWYVSDVSKFSAATGWAPKVGLAEGLGRLWEWCESVA